MNGQFAISFSDIDAARQRLETVGIRTPLVENPFINRMAGRRVLIKLECLQRTGSFKFRGAWSAMTALPEEQRARGVIAYSSGNHAQGIAHAAQLLGTPAVVIMPNDAPALKIANTRAYGAEVVLYDRPGGESREALGKALADERGLSLVKPYDNPYVMAGQGTCGIEIAEQASALGVANAPVLVCCGGGGLSSGIATALAELSPRMQVHPVEPDTSDDVKRSLQCGERVANEFQSDSICDAIVTPSPGELTFPILKARCGKGYSVSDTETLQAMALALIRLKVVSEPGGAVALAATLFRKDDISGDTVICVISGGNADPARIAQAIEQHGQWTQQESP